VAEQREAVYVLVDDGLSLPRTCALIEISRSTFLYTSKLQADQALLAQICELATVYASYRHCRRPRSAIHPGLGMTYVTAHEAWPG
jgi:hypothetical protein